VNFRITHLNAEAREILESVKQRIRVPVGAVIGQPLDVIETGWQHGPARAADPAGLPYAARNHAWSGNARSADQRDLDDDRTYAGPLTTGRLGGLIGTGRSEAKAQALPYPLLSDCGRL
jgi:hypothetical protein